MAVGTRQRRRRRRLLPVVFLLLAASVYVGYRYVMLLRWDGPHHQQHKRKPGESTHDDVPSASSESTADPRPLQRSADARPSSTSFASFVIPSTALPEKDFSDSASNISQSGGGLEPLKQVFSSRFEAEGSRPRQPASTKPVTTEQAHAHAQLYDKSVKPIRTVDAASTAFRSPENASRLRSKVDLPKDVPCIEFDDVLTMYLNCAARDGLLIDPGFNQANYDEDAQATMTRMLKNARIRPKRFPAFADKRREPRPVAKAPLKCEAGAGAASGGEAGEAAVTRGTQRAASRDVDGGHVDRERADDGRRVARGNAWGDGALGAGGRADRLGWRHVVFGYAVFEDVQTDRLLQAAADTWFRMVRGADVMLVTDGDDGRADSSVSPRVDGGVCVHVRRCASCRGKRCVPRRGQPCVGKREGWLARTKVLGLFSEMLALAEERPKRFFMKVDPDTVLLPHNLLRFLRQLDVAVSHRSALLFGMAACRAQSAALCHAAGGAAYGLSLAAAQAVKAEVGAGLDALLKASDALSYGGEDVTVALALRRQASVSVLNCGSFYQHEPLKYARMRSKGENWVRWPLSRNPMSFHKLKDADAYRAFFGCSLYDKSGKPRTFPRDLFRGPYSNGTGLQNGVTAAMASTDGTPHQAEPALRLNCVDPWMPNTAVRTNQTQSRIVKCLSALSP